VLKSDSGGGIFCFDFFSPLSGVKSESGSKMGEGMWRCWDKSTKDISISQLEW